MDCMDVFKSTRFKSWICNLTAYVTLHESFNLAFSFIKEDSSNVSLS